MNHEIRRTSAKLHRRLDLVAANRARESVSIEAFELQELGGSDVDAQRWLETADPAAWQPIPWGSTWGRPRVDVILRSRFTVPSRWSDDASSEVRLWLPIGRSGDFSHPEALVHVDGVPLAACDRHHQEIVLPDRYCDGASHQLVLHGWTGGVPEVMGPRRAKPPLVMSECSVQLVDRGVARFESLARVALGVADELDVDDPVRAGLYDALDAAFLTLDTREPLGDRFFESAANSSPTTSDPRRRAGCCGCRTCTATPGISRNYKAAGLNYFFTIKISWSQYNRLPYDSFRWQGLDGTSVLTHFSPTPNDAHPAWATYNAEARPVDVLETWRHYRQREARSADGAAGPMLMSYGHGDGGGGPTREMIENLIELESFPSMPRVRTTTVGAFFAELEKVGDRLPVWNSELYLEYHRGTYTSQAATKWGNRRGEFGLHNAEFLAAWARVLTGEVDRERIRDGEQPGSSRPRW